MPDAFIGVGSNLGQRITLINRAIKEINTHFPVIGYSKLYKSMPTGHLSQPEFVNCVIKIDYPYLIPYPLFELLCMIENIIGKNKMYKNGPRFIDLDILLIDNLIYHDPLLQIPHREMHNRKFVLMPLSDLLDKNYIIPGRQHSISYYLNKTYYQIVSRIFCEGV